MVYLLVMRCFTDYSIPQKAGDLATVLIFGANVSGEYRSRTVQVWGQEPGVYRSIAS